MIIGIVVGVIVLFILIALGRSVKWLAREYQRIVLFRLGRDRPEGAWLCDHQSCSLTGQPRSTFASSSSRSPHQTAITKDNAFISIDFIIFYKVMDPSMSVLEVQNFAGAAQNVAATTLRSVVGDMPLDDVLSTRDDMNASLRVRLDE